MGREDAIVEGLYPHFFGRAKYFTINVGGRIGPENRDQLFLELHRNNNKYEIFVHEPRFFTLNYIPVALPTLQRTIVVNKSESHLYPMIMAEVEELNLPQDPCNEDEKYNFQVSHFVINRAKITLRFQACVSKSITKILGCKLKWELLAGDTASPKCSTVSQFRYFLKFSFFLSPPREYSGLKDKISIMELEGIRKLTGCMKPYHYRE